jgi:hypothetical protein
MFDLSLLSLSSGDRLMFQMSANLPLHEMSLEEKLQAMEALWENDEFDEFGDRSNIAKQFVPPGQIKDFKATANSFPALGLEARHGTTTIGIPEPKMTLKEAEEMFGKLFQDWIKELKDKWIFSLLPTSGREGLTANASS